MSNIFEFGGKLPKIHPSCFIANNATITGEVTIGKDSSVWFQTVIRGDVCSIDIGKDVNIQDASIIHGTGGLSKVVIGNKVSIGHRAIIHGCSIEDGVLIGMGAIVLDNAIIESNCIVAAGSVVLQNETLKSGYLYGGIPARQIKKLDRAKLEYYIDGTAESYLELSKKYKL
jgi:carbonic anhydrase/acetyltransferase-like protein (isoleucine patch superfamily)